MGSAVACRRPTCILGGTPSPVRDLRVRHEKPAGITSSRTGTTSDMKTDLVTAIAQLEEVTTASPRTTRVLALAVVALGFLYIVVVLAGILVGGWLIGQWLTRAQEPQFLLLLVPTALVLFGSVAEACWVKSEPLVGKELTRDDAPKLFGVIDDLAQRLGTTVHAVIVDTKFNASASGRRRWFVGPSRNVIIVGYPLLCALDADDWRSVLAHEVAHIASAHSHKSDIFWRAATAWIALDERLRERKHWASIFFAWFFRRFAQLVQVLDMALRRQQEREADAMTAQIVGERTHSDALLRLAVRRTLTDEHFWEPLNQRATREPEPPAEVYSRHLPAFFDDIHQLDGRSALRVELRRRTEWHETHPSTYERHSKALNLSPADVDGFVDSWVDPPIGECAARTLLSDAARTRVATEFDGEWQQKRTQSWRQAFERAVERRRKLEAIEAAMGSQGLSIEERIERARLIALLEDDRTAEPVVRTALAEAPDDAGLLFLLGLVCLARDDAEGVGLMENAIAASPTLATPGTQALLEYVRRQGDVRAALAYQEQHHLSQVRDRERESHRKLTAASRFVHADLTPELVEAATRPLPNEPLVRRAWIAEVVVRHNVGRPTYVLMLETGWRVPGARRRDRALTHRIAPECQFDGHGLVVTVHTWRRLRRRIRRAAGEPVYVRGRPTSARQAMAAPLDA